MQKEFKLTQERLNELQQELTHLRTVREKEVADQIKEALAFGDLSENSEYDEAKNEQGKLFSRIAEIENIINHAVVIEIGAVGGDSVALGSTVTVVAQDDKSITHTFTIMGSQEANPMEGRISDESPFGKALLDAKKGDKVRVDAPGGKRIYVVKSVE
ncbi:MAG: transcription elongation factor GreA [Oscillospiraceae bacterium]|nr:transcription elongation factor GreA [Oscillospiraceae bacterium]